MQFLTDKVHDGILRLIRFTLPIVGAAPDYGKCGHRDYCIEQIVKFTGLPATSRIPKALRLQPTLFFQGFEQYKARTQKVLKGMDAAGQSLLPPGATTPEPQVGTVAIADGAAKDQKDAGRIVEVVNICVCAQKCVLKSVCPKV